MDILEERYKFLGRYLLAFIGSRAWDVAVCQLRIYSKMASGSHWLVKDEKKDESGGFEKDPDALWVGLDAGVALRDQILETTGQRIWGLTFTLYPDGKFNIEYDYNKPEDYEEDPPHQTFLDECMDALRKKTEEASAAWGLGTEARWDVDLAAGILSFDFAEGRQVRVPVQVVGTYDQNDGSFLWGWDHPSVPPPLRRAAEAVREYGAAHDIDSFVQRKVACSEDQAWEFAAAAAHLDDAAGAYRGPSGNTLVFMTFAAPN